MAPLLNLAVPENYPPPLLSPEQQRKRLLATLDLRSREAGGCRK
jgi:hypothetical protein